MGLRLRSAIIFLPYFFTLAVQGCGEGGGGVQPTPPPILDTATPTATGTPSPFATRTPTRTPTPTATVPATPTLPVVPGPQITFFGMATASDHVMTPIEVTPQGVPIYARQFGFGFFIVVEAKSGSSRMVPGIDNSPNPDDPSARPALQIEADHNLGNGSAAVCDIGPAPDQPIGGIPGINPPSFDPASQMVTDALYDFACRFEAHDSRFPCTLNDHGNPQFVASDTSIQLCTTWVVGHEVAFPQGDTLLTVQWRDTGGNFSLPRQIIVRVP
jgi:hypothetical protein